MDRKEEQGFRQIGSLMPTTEQLQYRKDTMRAKLTASQSASAITGSPSPVIVGSNLTGPRRGEITLRETSPGIRLAEMHPATVDKMIRERLPPRVVSLISTAEICNNDFDVIGYKPIKLSPSEALAALEGMDEFFHQAEYEMILKGLARGRAMTKRRTEQADDEEITLAAYADLFRPWPVDVTAVVLSRLHKLDGGWWPSALAVERELERYGRARVELRKALAEVKP